MLPLNLVSFKGTSTGKVTRLEWEVSHQTHTSTIQIERSLDGYVFETITTLPVSVAERYSYSTAQYENLVYYRLRMVDFDQFVSYSGIVKVTGNAETTTSFFINPNPVNGASKLVFAKPETAVLEVFNNTGEMVLQQKIFNQQQVPLKSNLLPTGSYLIVFTDNRGLRQVKRVVKL